MIEPMTPERLAEVEARYPRAAHNEEWAGNRTWDREGDAYRDSYRTFARAVNRKETP